MIFRKFTSTYYETLQLTSISTLRTNVLSGVRSSFMGEAMERSYRSCMSEAGKQGSHPEQVFCIANITLGRGSDARRKAIINGTLGFALFSLLMKKFQKTFDDLVDRLQCDIEGEIEKHLGHLGETLDIMRSNNVLEESEQDPEFRDRVEAQVTVAKHDIQQIKANLVL